MTQSGLILRGFQFLGMVGSNDKQSVSVPRLPLGGREELSDCKIGVADRLVNRQASRLESPAIFLRDRIGVMRTDRENSRRKIKGPCSDNWGSEGGF